MNDRSTALTPASIQLVDSHVHMDSAAFAADRDAVLARARAAGVEAMVVPAVTAEGWPALHALAQAHATLHPAYGLHPMFLHAHRNEHLARLEAWINNHDAVAIGECGLDFFGDEPQVDRQRQLFDGQLAIARNTGLPVIVHARRAVEEVVHTLRRAGTLRGVVHSFSGSAEQARQLADLGFLIGIGGPLTHAGSHRLHRLIATVPLDTLLLETDAPDQPGAAHRGQRNEPAWLIEVLDCVARLRHESRETVAATTRANAQRLFGLSKDTPTKASIG